MPDAAGHLHAGVPGGLPCPPPLQLAQVLAGALTPGQTVWLLSPQSPTSLLALLAGLGLQTEARTLPNGDICVKIHRPPRDAQAPP
ncbi:MAG: hypothetical protein KGJ96_05700 [Xanthomonadaceae bacterium]|nr:hypothetical protein [Xanthomonadaceae bacterium]